MYHQKWHLQCITRKGISNVSPAEAYHLSPKRIPRTRTSMYHQKWHINISPEAYQYIQQKHINTSSRSISIKPYEEKKTHHITNRGFTLSSHVIPSHPHHVVTQIPRSLLVKVTQPSFNGSGGGASLVCPPSKARQGCQREPFLQTDDPSGVNLKSQTSSLLLFFLYTFFFSSHSAENPRARLLSPPPIDLSARPPEQELHTSGGVASAIIPRVFQGDI
jgi:hypothetical protein